MEYLIGALIVAVGFTSWELYRMGEDLSSMFDEIGRMQRQIDEDTARLRDEFGIDLDEGADIEFAEWDC